MKDMFLPKIFEPFYCADLIRLGKDNDGGYLVNKEDILKSERLLSFGVSTDISFEEDFVKLNVCPIDAYDGTISHAFDFFIGNRKMHNYNIGYKTGNKKIADLISENDKNVFLKCDIEGSEYEILDELIVHSSKFSGMVIEFHDVYENILFNLLTNFISKIDLKLIHIHMNNNSYVEAPNNTYGPGCVELSFTSSKNISLDKVTLPHALDMVNHLDREEFRILF
jgi:hypothetical protein